MLSGKITLNLLEEMEITEKSNHLMVDQSTIERYQPLMLLRQNHIINHQLHS